MSESSGLERLVITAACCGATATVVIYDGEPDEALVGEPVHLPGCPYSWPADPDKGGDT